MSEIFMKCLDMARYKGVGFELVFEESANTFYGKTKGFVGKSKSVTGALEDLYKFLKDL